MDAKTLLANSPFRVLAFALLESAGYEYDQQGHPASFLHPPPSLSPHRPMVVVSSATETRGTIDPWELH